MVCKAVWDAKSKECFIRLCVGQVLACNKPGTHLSKVGWSNVIDNFREETGNAYDRAQMKNQWGVLKKEWQLWMNLLKIESGLGRDPITGAIDADNDWWELKLQCYPDASKFRHKGIQMEDEMRILFQDNTANGEYAYTPSSGVMPNS